MPGTKKQQTAKNSMTAREMWLQAVKGRSYVTGQKKGYSTTKKTPTEYWVGTLRKSQGKFIVAEMHTNLLVVSLLQKKNFHTWFTLCCLLFSGLQSEIASMDTFGNNRPSGDTVPYLSTSHYLREKVGVERNRRPNSTPDC